MLLATLPIMYYSPYSLFLMILIGLIVDCSFTYQSMGFGDFQIQLIVLGSFFYHM
jgi:hypothetical protein